MYVLHKVDMILVNKILRPRNNEKYFLLYEYDYNLMRYFVKFVQLCPSLTNLLNPIRFDPTGN